MQNSQHPTFDAPSRQAAGTAGGALTCDTSKRESGIRLGNKATARLLEPASGFLTSFQLSAVLIASLTVAGCGRPHATVLGRAPEGQVRTILSVRAGDTPPQVTIAGVMVEKCPVAGCWFRVQDRTGIVKVDTKSAGFVVVNLPLQTHVTVAGRVIPDGNDVVIEATGMSY